MKALVLHAPGQAKVDDVERPVPGPKDVLVGVRACGVCGSDLAREAGGAHHFPIILGHEFAGEVAEVGEQVEKWKPGDRVVAVPLLPCFACANCERGLFALCADYSFIGSRCDGGMAEFCVVPEGNLFPLPDELIFAQGALFEPATVTLHGVLALPKPGAYRSVVVLGVGAIGAFGIQWAKTLGASKVIAVDIREDSLELALAVGAAVTVNSREENAIERVMGETKGGAELVIETAGVPASQTAAWQLARPRGRVLQVGTAAKPVEFPAEVFECLLRRELTVHGSWMSYSDPFPGREWSMTAETFASGQLIWEPILSHRLPLSEAAGAFSLAHRSCGKVLIETGSVE
ncbi:MAG: galactitol-1-phosphate 5-dehydrogenase [Planctomycetes bacterium]|nr:galactitol-1-phosphate 5-dehydrogenase [Planctomycetota bacterium]